MRGTSFDRYDGRSWARSALPSVGISPIGDVYAIVRDDRPTDARYDVILDHLDEPVIFLPAGTVAVGVPPRVRAAIDRTREIILSPGLDVRYVDADALGLAYRVYVGPDVGIVEQLDDEARARYLALPRGVDRVHALAVRVAGDASTDAERADRILAYLRDSGRFRYSLEMENMGDRNPLDFFLFDARYGDCEYYSTAMAVMLRTLGVPTRNVTGFVGGRYNPYGRYYAIKNGDAHSWLEVWLDGAWITYDPTPPARDEYGVEEGALAELRAMLDALRTRWDEDVVGYDLRSQVEGLRALFRFAYRVRSAFEGDPDQAQGAVPAPARRTSSPWGVFAVVALAVVALGLLLLRMRRRRRDPTEPTADARAAVRNLPRARARPHAPRTAPHPHRHPPRARRGAPRGRLRARRPRGGRHPELRARALGRLGPAARRAASAAREDRRDRRECAEPLIRCRPDDVSTSIEDLTARAKQLIAERRYQEAVRACRRILLSRPAMTQVRILLGMALLALRRHDEVRAEMMAVLRTAPDEATAHRLLGEAYLRDAQVDKAREALRRALELDPTDEEARELLNEVASEEPPAHGTVDRWFDPEAVATVQTDVPAFEDEKTSALSVKHFAIRPRAPAVEPLDELANEPTIAGPPPRAPRPMSAPPPRPMSAPPPRPVSAPPPRPPPPPLAGPPSRSSFPPPPGAHAPYPGSAGGPRRPVVPHSSFPPAPGPSYGAPETGLERPHVRRDLGDTITTEELPLSDVEPPYGAPMYAPEAWDGAGPPLDPMGEPAPWGDAGDAGDAGTGIYVPDEPEDPADFDRPSDDWSPLEEQKTVARPPPGDASVPPPSMEGTTSPFGGAAPSVSPPAGTAAVPAPSAQAPKKVPRAGGARRVRVIALAVAVPLVLGVSAFFGIRAWLESRAETAIQAATATAEDDGAETSLGHAIELAEEHDGSDAADVALRARLSATAVLEHREDRAAQARTLLETLEGADAALPDAVIARTYLALASGDATAAGVAITAADATAEPSAELWHARALAARAAGNTSAALDAARQASAARPTAPRHAALYALLTADDGDVQAALDALGGARDAEASPIIRAARARVVRASGSDPERAEAEASVVLTDLESVASPPDRAWARLVRAECRVVAGEPAQALEDARAALVDRPPGDEQFALELAQLFLDARAPEDAGRLLESLPEESTDRPRRARLRAAVALEVNDSRRRGGGARVRGRERRCGVLARPIGGGARPAQGRPGLLRARDGARQQSAGPCADPPRCARARGGRDASRSRAPRRGSRAEPGRRRGGADVGGSAPRRGPEVSGERDS